MSKVIIDADELDAFATALNSFNRDLAGMTSKLRAQFSRLGETWRDPQYAKFSQEFQQTMKDLERFQRTADETIPKLRKTAQRTRDVYR